jgi:hypothetical protein
MNDLQNYYEKEVLPIVQQLEGKLQTAQTITNKRKKIAWLATFLCAAGFVAILGYSGFLFALIILVVVWGWALQAQYDATVDWNNLVIPLALKYKIGEQIMWKSNNEQPLVLDEPVAMFFPKQGEKIKRSFSHNIIGVLEGQPFHFFKTTYLQDVARNPLTYFAGWVCMLKLPQIVDKQYLIKKGGITAEHTPIHLQNMPEWSEATEKALQWKSILSKNTLTKKEVHQAVLDIVVFQKDDYLLLACNEHFFLFDVKKQILNGTYQAAFEQIVKDVEQVIEKINLTKRLVMEEPEK